MCWSGLCVRCAVWYSRKTFGEGQPRDQKRGNGETPVVLRGALLWHSIFWAWRSDDGNDEQGDMPTATRIFSRYFGFAEHNREKMVMILIYCCCRLLLFRGMSRLLARVPCLHFVSGKVWLGGLPHSSVPFIGRRRNRLGCCFARSALTRAEFRCLNAKMSTLNNKILVELRTRSTVKQDPFSEQEPHTWTGGSFHFHFRTCTIHDEYALAPSHSSSS